MCHENPDRLAEDRENDLAKVEAPPYGPRTLPVTLYVVVLAEKWADYGLAANRLIASGGVKVNNQVVTDPHRLVYDDDTVVRAGKKLPRRPEQPRDEVE